MDNNSIPTELLMAGGIALLSAMLPTLFGRKGSGDSEVIESLLTRVNHLRQGQFPGAVPGGLPALQRSRSAGKTAGGSARRVG